MKATGYYDFYGQEIYVGYKYEDRVNKVFDIEIIENNEEFFAVPKGLDAELLSFVAKDLVLQSK